MLTIRCGSAVTDWRNIPLPRLQNSLLTCEPLVILLLPVFFHDS
jgi:hypothetical protein